MPTKFDSAHEQLLDYEPFIKEGKLIYLNELDTPTNAETISELVQAKPKHA